MWWRWNVLLLSILPGAILPLRLRVWAEMLRIPFLPPKCILFCLSDTDECAICTYFYALSIYFSTASYFKWETRISSNFIPQQDVNNFLRLTFGIPFQISMNVLLEITTVVPMPCATTPRDRTIAHA